MRFSLRQPIFFGFLCTFFLCSGAAFSAPQNEDALYLELKMRAEEGDARSQYLLARLLEEGLGVPKDAETALAWYRQSAQKEEPEAQFYLGNLLLKQSDDPQKNAEGMTWLMRSAKQGHLLAQTTLASIYETGAFGQKRSDSEAVRWYGEAAKKEDAKSQYALGMRYIKGQGVKMDTKEAIKWLTLSAQQGFLQAQAQLAMVYFSKLGSQDADREALKWFKAAAAQGHASSLYMLGFMFNNGQVVPENHVLAYAFFSLSAHANPQLSNPALRMLSDFSKQLSSEEIAEAHVVMMEMVKEGNFIRAMDAYVNR